MQTSHPTNPDAVHLADFDPGREVQQITAMLRLFLRR